MPNPNISETTEPKPDFPMPMDIDIIFRALEECFMLFYIHGANPAPRVKIFRHSGPLREAIGRGQRFCEAMGYRYVRVEPFLINFEAEMKKATDNT